MARNRKGDSRRHTDAPDGDGEGEGIEPAPPEAAKHDVLYVNGALLRDYLTTRRDTEAGYKAPNRKVIHLCQEIIDYIGRREAERPGGAMLLVDGSFLYRVVGDFQKDEEEKGREGNKHYLTILTDVRDYISQMELME